MKLRNEYNLAPYPFNLGHPVTTDFYFNGIETSGDSVFHSINWRGTPPANSDEWGQRMPKCSTYLSRESAVRLHRQQIKRKRPILSMTAFDYIDPEYLTRYNRSPFPDNHIHNTFLIVQKRAVDHESLSYRGHVSMEKPALCLLNFYIERITALDTTTPLESVTLAPGTIYVQDPPPVNVWEHKFRGKCFFAVRDKNSIEENFVLSYCDEKTGPNKVTNDDKNESFSTLFLSASSCTTTRNNIGSARLVSEHEMYQEIHDSILAATGWSMFALQRTPKSYGENANGVANVADTVDFGPRMLGWLNTILDPPSGESAPSVDYNDLNLFIGGHSCRSQLGSYLKHGGLTLDEPLLVNEFMEYAVFKFEFTDGDTNEIMFRKFFVQLIWACKKIYSEFEEKNMLLSGGLVNNKSKLVIPLEPMFSAPESLFNRIPPSFYIGTMPTLRATGTTTEGSPLAGLTKHELDLFVLYMQGLMTSENVKRFILSSPELSRKFEHLTMPLHVQPVYKFKQDVIEAALAESIGKKFPGFSPQANSCHYKMCDVIVLIKKPVLDMGQFKRDVFAAVKVNGGADKCLKLIQTAQVNLHPHLAVSPLRITNNNETCGEERFEDYVYGSVSRNNEQVNLRENTRYRPPPRLELTPFRLH
jgi:hypothetical protein